MKLCIKLENGREVEARTEEWLAALIVILPKEQRAALIERVEKKLVAYSTPGSHILHAEGGVFGFGR
jgi:hypothetical protein